MNDYWNHPPDHPEPPEWYSELEIILNEMNPPQSVARSIRKTMDDWVDQHNQDHYGDMIEQFELFDELGCLNPCFHSNDHTTPRTDDLARGNHVVPTLWAEELEQELATVTEQFKWLAAIVESINSPISCDLANSDCSDQTSNPP